MIITSAGLQAERGTAQKYGNAGSRERLPQADSPGQPGHAQWHHHWVVRMHKVNQWYPSLNQHRVRFAAPTSKDPQTSPSWAGTS